ncbi:UNVERIFIED_ORG: putative transcriptional regulator [Methylorubrum zatmanii]|nr:putative transcriptional regulator [Methylorubrum zatmanii]
MALVAVRRLQISEGILRMSLEDGSAGDHVALVVDIVSAYVGNNSLAVGELPGLITSVHGALAHLSNKPSEPEEPAPTPAVSIRRSIQQDFLICLEDGKKFKSLKRHLRTRYNLSPDEYRARWNLPDDYPMVAPSYAAIRSELARTMGLGQQRRKWPSKRRRRRQSPNRPPNPLMRPAPRCRVAVAGPAPRTRSERIADRQYRRPGRQRSPGLRAVGLRRSCLSTRDAAALRQRGQDQASALEVGQPLGGNSSCVVRASSRSLRET